MTFKTHNISAFRTSSLQKSWVSILDAAGILSVSVAVAQEACVSVSVSAELGTEVFDGAVGFFEIQAYAWCFCRHIPFMLSVLIWLSNARLPILLNANDRWQKQQRTIFESFNGFTQDENCGLMVSSNYSWLKTQDITEYFCILLLNLKDIKNTHIDSHWGWNAKERVLRQPNDS